VKSNAASFLPSLSGDGRSVAFISAATNLSPHDHDEGTDVYLKDMVTGRIRLISVSNEGRNVNQDCQSMALSSDGLTVAFETDGKLDPADTDALHDIYVWDGRTGELSLASTNSAGAKGDGHSQAPALSADGSLVAFTSQSTNLDPLDVDAQPDVFVKDVGTGSIALASITGNGVKGNDDSLGPTLSADGTRVAFTSYASNLDPRNRDGIAEIYLKDLVTGTLTLVSATRRGRIGDGESGWAAISADGRYVAFGSEASNIVPDDSFGNYDVFVADRLASTTERVSVSSDGTQGNDSSNFPLISADGRFVAFESQSSNLVAADTNGNGDVFVRDRVSGTTERVSISSTGVQGNNQSYVSSISADGRYVAFNSSANNLVPGGDANGLNDDVFVRDRQLGTTWRQRNRNADPARPSGRARTGAATW
jgi:Tol biopolymer transport system component